MHQENALDFHCCHRFIATMDVKTHGAANFVVRKDFSAHPVRYLTQADAVVCGNLPFVHPRRNNLWGLVFHTDSQGGFQPQSEFTQNMKYFGASRENNACKSFGFMIVKGGCCMAFA
jgi:hypothetical protein